MLLRIPKYYTKFQCIANRCKDTCCVGWEINIDEDTYDYYQQIPGKFGKRLRQNTSNEREKKFLLKGKSCPFLNQENLCDICIELGEESLCETCTEYPRSIMEYANVREKCLSLSCEEAARLIFESAEKCEFEEVELYEEYEECREDGLVDEYDEFREDGLKVDIHEISKECLMTSDFETESLTQVHFFETIRVQAIAFIQARELPFEIRMDQLLRFGQKVQGIIDHKSLKTLDAIIQEFKDEEILHRTESGFNFFENNMNGKVQESICSLKSYESKEKVVERLNLFREMESVDEEWDKIFQSIIQLFGSKEFNYITYTEDLKLFSIYYQDREYEYEHLLVYFLFRYGMMAIYDHNFYSKTKFAVISFLMIRDMDVNCFIRQNQCFTKQNRIDNARIYSKQVEHAQEILDYIEKRIQSF